MTKNEMLKMIVEGAVVTAEMAEKAAEILAADAKAKEARKGKVSEKEQAKRDANEALARRVVAEILGAEPKTATDIAAEMNALMPEALEKPANAQKASALMKKALELGLVTVTEVKLPKVGKRSAYAAA